MESILVIFSVIKHLPKVTYGRVYFVPQFEGIVLCGLGALGAGAKGS